MNLTETYKTNLIIGNKAQHTIRTYVKDVTKFVEHFGITEKNSIEILNSLTSIDIKNFYGSQSQLSPDSLNGLIRSIIAFFHWLESESIITLAHPFFKVKFGKNSFVKVPKKVKMVLTDDESEALIKAGADVQTRFMIALMLFTAIRRDEVCKIKLSDINENEILIEGKGGKQRKVYMDETLLTFFHIYKAQRNTSSEYLFYGTRGDLNESKIMSGNTVNNRIQTAGKLSGISPEKLERLTAHKTRATRITMLTILYGLETAAKVAGHANTNVTKGYDASEDEVTRRALLGQRKLTNEIRNQNN